MKRFYKEAAAAPAAGGYTVLLDDKPIRTPAKAALVVPNRKLADAIAAEWQAQGDEIEREVLELTRLASTAIDLVAPRHGEIVAQVTKFAVTDLVCYRAEHPPELVERQHRVWQPLVDWAAARHGAPLAVTVGVVPTAQPPESIAALAAAVAAHDAMALAALNLATAACGSLVVALALAEGRLDADEAFVAAQLEESFEIERWGEDGEQTARRAALRADIALAARFMALLGA